MVNTRDLFQRVMKSDWNYILEMCENQPEALTVKITRAGDTLLHLAVSDGKEKEVQKLVELITKPGNEAIKNSALGTVNEMKNTALHLAASMGNVIMCKWIAEAEPDLIGDRNVDGETPFFLAATHGKLEAFLFLHSICKEKGLAYARKNGGETVLHSAIHGDYFELAFQIIKLYGDLVDYRSEEGMSPLHLLATKPTVFKSGTPLGWFQSIIYYCIFIEDLKWEATEYKRKIIASTSDERSNTPHNCPENYTTCISFFRLLYKMFRVLVSTGSNKNDPKKNKLSDTENPPVQQRNELFPANYETCYEAIKLIYKAMLIFLGLGSRKIEKLREKKEKHTRAVQIMNLLIENTRIYEHEDSGGNPGISSTAEGGETTPYTLGEAEDDIMGPTYLWTEDEPFLHPIINAETPDSESNQNGGIDNEQGVCIYIYVNEKYVIIVGFLI